MRIAVRDADALLNRAQRCLEFGWTILMITHDIREAVYLSDRVVVLSRRPAHVRRSLDIPLQRPRDRTVVTTQDFALVEEVVSTEWYGSKP